MNIFFEDSERERTLNEFCGNAQGSRMEKKPTLLMGRRRVIVEKEYR